MSKGLHRNQEAYQKGHGDLGRGVRRAGVKTAAVKIPGSDAPPWNTDRTGKRIPKTTYMNKGGYAKKRKGYNDGGVVHELTNKPVEVAYTTEESLRRAGIK